MAEAPRPRTCVECGEGAVFHRLTYITVAIDDVMRPLFTPSSWMRSLFSFLFAFERWATPRLLSFFVRIRLARKEEQPDERTALLVHMLWKEAEARGIHMWELRLFGLPRNVFLAEYPDGQRIAFEGIPLPPHAPPAKWWMDNKARLKKEFKKLSIPVAEGSGHFTTESALNAFKKLVPPVIVKPHSGSGSRHTILHVNKELELLRAFEIAKQLSPFAVVEEELKGPVFRATVVAGKLAATLRRDPPSVVGDGRKSVRRLVEEANTHPARQGPYFSHIKLTPHATQELAWQGLTLDSVPKKEQHVALHQKINWSLGGTTVDVTDNVHPDNRELFERVAEVLDAPIVGIDFIIADMGKSWREQERCGVIECNSMPFFDNHHLPFEGEPRNVAAHIWDMVSPV